MKALLALLIALPLMSISLTSCKEESKTENAAEDVMEGAQENMEEAGEAMEEGAEDMGDSMQDAADEAGDAMEDAAE